MGEVVSITEEDTFDQFWAKYPRKVGKLKARVAWNRITSGGKVVNIDGEGVNVQGTPEEILAGLDEYIFRNSNPLNGWLLAMEFTPLAVTWLNQMRWDDA